MWTGFSALFIIFTILFFIAFITILIKIISEAAANRKAPKLIVNAKLIDKEKRTSHQHNTATNMTTMSTSYFMTFEVEGGDRITLKCDKNSYDNSEVYSSGKLTFKGTMFISFEGDF